MQNFLDRMIEKCIGIRGNVAFNGSYAAPREAFRDVLEEVRKAEGDRIKKLIIKKYYAELQGDEYASDPKDNQLLELICDDIDAPICDDIDAPIIEEKKVGTVDDGMPF